MKKLFILLTISIACSAQTDQDKVESTEIQQVQEKSVIAKRVSPSEFDEIIERDNIQLVDVRTPGEYEAGAFDGAVNIDFMGDDFIAKCEKNLDKDEPLAIYCAAGGRSAKALQKLKQAGFKEIYELGVGYNGYPH